MNTKIEHLKVLILDDDPADSELLYEQLADMSGYDVQTFKVLNIKSALDVLERFAIDLIIVDNCLGYESGIDAINNVGGRYASSAIIMISGMFGKEVQQAALDAGAVNFLNKNGLNCELLEITIRSAIHTQALLNQA